MGMRLRGGGRDNSAPKLGKSGPGPKVAGTRYRGGNTASPGPRKNTPVQAASKGTAVTTGHHANKANAITPGDQSKISALSGGTNKGGSANAGARYRGGASG